MNRDHSVVFEIASKYCISDSFVDHDGYSISSKGFLPVVVDIMVIELNSPIPVHFSSLIPKMLMITLAMSLLQNSDLKKGGKTTRLFRYDLNQIPYDYTVEVTNRFKGLELIECLKNYGWRFMTLYRRQ